ncbi:Osteoclast-stimulating factor 1 [Gaertneriomyces sp. JEL0708]|nr:Osteoclast-stimulating factor 1 [Gaertneriomyces sp. JEL0708]
MAAPPPRPSRPGPKAPQALRALYSYTAQNADELSFEEDDVLYVISKDEEHWWKCKCGDRVGLVPKTYGKWEESAGVDAGEQSLATQHLTKPYIYGADHFIVVGENTAPLDNPLHEASKRGNLPFATELLSAGLSPNTLDKAGNTPLHWASRSGHLEIAQLLLRYRPELNSQNKLGDTPLHLASWGGHAGVVGCLLEQGVETGIRNNEGSTPLDVARNDEVASLLMQFLGGTSGEDVGDGDESD